VRNYTPIPRLTNGSEAPAWDTSREALLPVAKQTLGDRIPNVNFGNQQEYVFFYGNHLNGVASQGVATKK